VWLFDMKKPCTCKPYWEVMARKMAYQHRAVLRALDKNKPVDAAVKVSSKTATKILKGKP